MATGGHFEKGLKNHVPHFSEIAQLQGFKTTCFLIEKS